MQSQIKLLSKNDRPKQIDSANQSISAVSPLSTHLSTSKPHPTSGLSLPTLKHSADARPFKLIDSKEWNVASCEPPSEATFFSEGNSAMSIISVLGPRGVGKSSLLNRIARRQVFETYNRTKYHARHTTRGIDVYSTYQRILLDCQPLNATSVLEDFLTGESNSQFSKSTLSIDSLTCCHMISIQLATFLITVSDHIIIMLNWLVDIHFLKTISTAIMLIGEDNIRARFVIYSQDCNTKTERFKKLIGHCLGSGRIEKFLDNEQELIAHVIPYSSEKCEQCRKDPPTYTGKNWLNSCQKLWNTTIKNSSMFSDYALQLQNSFNA